MIDTWHKRLMGGTGLYVFGLIWLPVLLAIDSARKRYMMESFDFFNLPALAMVWYAAVLIVTLLAQWGLVEIATSMDEAKKRIAHLEAVLEAERERDR